MAEKKTQKGAKVPQKSVARRTTPVPTPVGLMAKVAADSGGGMEGTDRDSFAIPFIRVLQSNSPQCTAGQAAYMKNAKPGMLFNTVTGELFSGDDGLVFVPCAFQRRFILWGARGTESAGYKGELTAEDTQARIASGDIAKGEDGRLYIGPGTNPKKNDRVSDTRNHFGLILNADGGAQQALLSLSSSQIKKSKQLMGILSAIVINGETPPTWLSKIRITSTPETNDQGSWFGVRVEHEGFVDDEKTYDLGAAFHKVVSSGKGRVNYSDEQAQSDDAEPERF